MWYREFEVKVEYDARALLSVKLCCEHNESMLRSRSEDSMQGGGRMVSLGSTSKGDMFMFIYGVTPSL